MIAFCDQNDDLHRDVKQTLNSWKRGKQNYHVPFPAIGEAYLVANNKNRVNEVFDNFHNYVKRGILIPEGINNSNCYSYAHRLLKSTISNGTHKNGWGEQYLQSTDALILACALSNNQCTHFLTSDTQINTLDSLDKCARDIRDEMNCDHLKIGEIW